MISEEISASGPEGILAGTLTLPDQHVELDDNTPVAIIVPGSGPTDRDGNSPLGISANTYRLLCEALAEKGVPTVRFDKRGMFGSMSAAADANDVTIESYGDDLLAWIDTIRSRLPRKDGLLRRVVPIGHSEGGLVVLAAANRIERPYKMVLIACPGRPLSDVLKEQLHANVDDAGILAQANAALCSLQNGKNVATSGLDPELAPLFSSAVQPFLIDLFKYDPAALMRKNKLPTLVLQGSRDLQVTVKDAAVLVGGSETALLTLMPNINHVMKHVAEDTREANISTYSNGSLPIAPIVIEAISAFLASS
ncbi:MAG: alpha/beta fold hydrolase [Yoonia sp.]|uniref:alpha/beta hydrolase n=1 Tax=Yoonia sp. TaxID=2212373 RepID=UPI00273F7CD7|nr:alpha/beta fold hydrolase [Yoonia sp.]MDP5086596.1 alpha/beta fold hydrolase [Yoonia sp.]